MKPLKLPPTIRTARLDELPARPDLIERIEKRKHANIVEGFTLRKNPSNDHPFEFYAEINIDNDRLWLLFTTLLQDMPREISLIYGHIDDEPSYGPYVDKADMLERLTPYKNELSCDGFLEFGIIHQQDTYLEEVYVKKSKFIQYWGMNEARFRDTMSSYTIHEVEGLNFIDEYPLATEALRLHDPEAIETMDVLKQLGKSFLD